MSVPEAGHAAQEYATGDDATLDSGLSSTLTITPPQAGTADNTEKATNSQPMIVGWDGDSDPQNPFNWSERRKWLIIGTAILGTLIMPVNGTAMTVAADAINKEFHISDASFPNSYWPITSWSLGGCVFIIAGLPLLEEIGVRVGYLSFYTLFFIMLIPQALAPNFATLIVTRFFAGGCVTMLANALGSVIPDLWASDEARNLPVSIWILMYLVGSTWGPPGFAGVMQYIGNWRWIFYIQLIMFGAFYPLSFFAIRETRGSVILRQKAKRLRRETGAEIYAPGELKGESVIRGLGKAAYRPIFLICTEPVLAAATAWSAFSFGTVYLFTQSVVQVFEGVYGWRGYSTGYVQGAVVLGEVLGWPLTLLSNYLYERSRSRNTESPGQPIPEARLYVSIAGSFLGLAGGMFVYAWTADPNISWVAPAAGLAMVGAGIDVVVTAVADYIVDAYAASAYAGSAVSAAAAGENLVAGLLPLAAQSMYGRLGVHWASTLLAFVALLLSCAPVVLVWKGRFFRERSPFMLSAGGTLCKAEAASDAAPDDVGCRVEAA